MIVYHGTVFKDAQRIREGINTKINFTDEKELDFGYGFYMADHRNYAVKTACSKARGLMEVEQDCAPVVLVLDLDIESILQECKENALIFKRKNYSFLKSVFEARMKRAGVDTFEKQFIVGPIADGRVDNVMRWYLKKPSRIRKAIALFRYWLPVMSRQYVLKDSRLCKYVSIIGEEEVK